VTVASRSTVNSTNPLVHHLAEMAAAEATFISFQHPTLQLSPRCPHEYAEIQDLTAKERGRVVGMVLLSWLKYPLEPSYAS
jgi:hypothetical protein